MATYEFDVDRTHTLPVLDAAMTVLAPGEDAGSAVWRDAELAERLRIAEALSARYLEALQAREHQRGLADARVRALETDLDAARRRSQALEGERTALNTTLAALRAECEALRTPAPSAAKPSDTGAWRGASARGLELDAERSARLAAERASRAAEIRSVELAARVAELEARCAQFERALQAQTEAAQRATAAVEDSTRTAAELHARVEALTQAAAEAEAQHGAERAVQEQRDQQLAAELERARDALAERERQVRRLEQDRVASDAAALASAPAAALQPLSGAAAFALAAGARTRIGRAPDNELQLEDSSVSRHHALVICAAGAAFIEDLHSVNGVGVNGRRVRQARLADGDIVTIGTQRFRFASGTSRPG